MSSSIVASSVNLRVAAPARAGAAARRTVVAAAHTGNSDASTPRRAFLGAAFGALAAVSVSSTSVAFAKSLEEAEAEKAARKEAVRAAAAASAATGRGESAFITPDRGLSEESKTPNFHTRQEEGLRTSGGA